MPSLNTELVRSVSRLTGGVERGAPCFGEVFHAHVTASLEVFIYLSAQKNGK